MSAGRTDITDDVLLSLRIERDDAERELRQCRETVDAVRKRAEAAEAEVARLRIEADAAQKDYEELSEYGWAERDRAARLEEAAHSLRKALLANEGPCKPKCECVLQETEWLAPPAAVAPPESTAERCAGEAMSAGIADVTAI